MSLNIEDLRCDRCLRAEEDIDGLVKECVQLEDEVKRLRAALRRYGQHEGLGMDEGEGCPALYVKFPSGEPNECRCGLDLVLHSEPS